MSKPNRTTNSYAKAHAATLAVTLLAIVATLPLRAPEATASPSTCSIAEAWLDGDQVQILLEERLGKHKAPRFMVGAVAERIHLLSRRLGMDPAQILSVIEAESHFRSNVVSRNGAIGLMQLLPDTARFVARQYGIRDYRGRADLFDPVINVTLGIHYLAYLEESFRDFRLVMMAYNMGPARLRKLLSTSGIPRRRGSVQLYADAVRSSAPRWLDEVRRLELEKSLRSPKRGAAVACAKVEDFAV
jgi:soluble lytic murein transglycosylase-like protein